MSANRTPDSRDSIPVDGPGSEHPAARKAYSSPQLTRYGDVQKLTGGSNGTLIDGTGGLSKVT